MINAREELLSKIKAGLDPLQSRARREKSVETRLSNPSKHVIPKRAQLDRAKRILLFQQMAEEVAATTSRVSSLNELPETIIEYLSTTTTFACTVKFIRSTIRIIITTI